MAITILGLYQLLEITYQIIIKMDYKYVISCGLVLLVIAIYQDYRSFKERK
jgi:hypothetical protein